MGTQGLSTSESIDQEELKDLLSIVSMLRGYLNDHVVKELSDVIAPLSKLAAAMSGTDLVDILERSLQDPELDRALLAPPKVGFTGMVKAMGDADVQRGMGIMLQLLRSMGKAAARQ